MFDWTRICYLGIVANGLSDYQKKQIKQFTVEHDEAWLVVKSKYSQRSKFHVEEACLYADERLAKDELRSRNEDEILRSDSETLISRFDMSRYVKMPSEMWYVCIKVKKIK